MEDPFDEDINGYLSHRFHGDRIGTGGNFPSDETSMGTGSRTNGNRWRYLPPLVEKGEKRVNGKFLNFSKKTGFVESKPLTATRLRKQNVSQLSQKCWVQQNIMVVKMGY